jgi:ankyrin repeat protein
MNDDIWNILKDKNLCYHDASMYDDIDKIFLIKLYHNDIEYVQQNYMQIKSQKIKDSCLMIAITYATTKIIIEFIIDKFEININNYKFVQRLRLISISIRNGNLEIIKYLFEDLKMNILPSDSGKAYLFIACSETKNVDVMKYLIEEKRINVSNINLRGQNCLMLACQNNENVEIIKYLIEEQKMDISQTDGNGNNCFVLACANKNLKIIKYLIEETNIDLSLNRVLLTKFEQFIELITKKYSRLNELIEKAIEHYKFSNDLKVILMKINPLLLSDNVRTLLNIENPFDATFDKFIINADKLECAILSIEKVKKINKIEKREIYSEKELELLFKHNDKEYYGHADIIYDAVYVLNGLQKYDRKDPIVLSGKTPEYIMSLYIQSCYDSTLNLNEIKMIDFESFLSFIDQYPTKYVSLDSLEIDLIKYMKFNDICPNVYIRNLCNKYQLKYMYLYIKQKIK